jgi:hypothetical protein
VKSPLDAVTDKLSACARNLFQLPATTWMDRLQPNIMNPVDQLEQILKGILGQDQNQEDSTVTPLNSQTKTSSPSALMTTGFKSGNQLNRELSSPPDRRNAQPSNFRSASSNTTKPKAHHQDLLYPQKLHSHAPSQPVTAPKKNSNMSETLTSAAPLSNNSETAQSTRLLTGVNDLQNLFRSITQQNGLTSAQTETTTEQVSHPPENSDSKNPGSVEPAKPGVAPAQSGDLPQHHSKFTKNSNTYEQNQQNFPRRDGTSGEPPPIQRENYTEGFFADRDVQNPAAAKPKAVSGAVSESAISDPLINPSALAIRRQSADNFSPLHPQSEVLLNSAGSDEELQTRILSVITSLDGAAQDLLLEQLLDRLEERQRELVLRSLGLTGGQI